jgi:hypothetical protein
MLAKYSFFNMMKIYRKRKELIDAQLKGKSIEGFNVKSPDLGDYGDAFMIMFIIFGVIWIWAVYALVKNWNNLPTFARAIGLIALFVPMGGGPIITLIVVFAAKGQRKL